jgi:hypothetical protein
MAKNHIYQKVCAVLKAAVILGVNSAISLLHSFLQCLEIIRLFFSLNQTGG